MVTKEVIENFILSNGDLNYIGADIEAIYEILYSYSIRPENPKNKASQLSNLTHLSNLACEQLIRECWSICNYLEEETESVNQVEMPSFNEEVPYINNELKEPVEDPFDSEFLVQSTDYEQNFNSVPFQLDQLPEDKKAGLFHQGVFCAYCRSLDVQFMQNNKKVFSVGKAVGGAILTGGVGALAGFAGKKGKNQWHCQNCGKTFSSKK
ncbi:hypothetical protein AB6884_14945 [Carnobacterium maltaromaticum]|uniref:hypothetical protein n=1 Tax=Carnobacterium maltaromaticum TaxID=2751 RepID=UPI0039AECC6A